MKLVVAGQMFQIRWYKSNLWYSW